jgi:hypothetical protein
MVIILKMRPSLLSILPGPGLGTAAVASGHEAGPFDGCGKTNFDAALSQDE